MTHKISEIKISYSSNKLSKEKVKNSSLSYELLRSFYSDDTIELYEESKILLLNRANQPLGVFNLSKGGTSSTIVDTKLIFSIALKTNASAIILAHNHPSGNLTPSESDIRVTKTLKTAGKILDISFCDHLIITAKGYFSFADNGLL